MMISASLLHRPLGIAVLALFAISDRRVGRTSVRASIAVSAAESVMPAADQSKRRNLENVFQLRMGEGDKNDKCDKICKRPCPKKQSLDSKKDVKKCKKLKTKKKRCDCSGGKCGCRPTMAGRDDLPDNVSRPDDIPDPEEPSPDPETSGKGKGKGQNHSNRSKPTKSTKSSRRKRF